MPKKKTNTKRTDEQLIEHYEIEKKLANKLRNASKEQRRSLYSSLYDELYRLVPHHSQLTRKMSSQQQEQAIISNMKLLHRFLDKDISFLEVGPGDCALSFEVAKHVKKVYAVDVSTTITENLTTPENFKLHISDGCSIPLPKNSIDVVYSQQLMEHLHPDDAYDQLKNIFAVVAPGGVYLCITPNRLNGPHDISKYFDTVATGFHLKEYTIIELSRLFKKVGFSKVSIYLGVRGIYIKVPIFLPAFCECMLKLLPIKLQQIVAKTKLIRVIISIRIVGHKSNPR